MYIFYCFKILWCEIINYKPGSVLFSHELAFKIKMKINVTGRKHLDFLSYTYRLMCSYIQSMHLSGFWGFLLLAIPTHCTHDLLSPVAGNSDLGYSSYCIFNIKVSQPTYSFTHFWSYSLWNPPYHRNNILWRYSFLQLPLSLQPTAIDFYLQKFTDCSMNNPRHSFQSSN